MRQPNFSNNEFVDQTNLNTAMSSISQSIGSAIQALHTAGLINDQMLGLNVSGNVITLSAPPPFAVLFPTGQVSGANGLVNGETNFSYALDTTLLIPTSGSVIVNIVAELSEIYQDPIQIVGPPVGHPDFNPNFVPYTAYAYLQNTVNFQLSSTFSPLFQVMVGTVELFAGQSSVSLSSIDLSVHTRAGSILSRNGEVLPVDLAPNGVKAGSYSGLLTFTLTPAGTISGITSYSVPGVPTNGSVYTSPMSITMGPNGIVAKIQNNQNLAVPQNITVGGTSTVTGSSTVNGNQSVKGFSYLNGGANVPYAQTANNPVALGQLDSLIPQLFTSFNNVTGSRSVNSTYTNTTGRPMVVSVTGNTYSPGNNTTMLALYINGVQMSINGYTGGGGDGNFSVVGMVPNGSQYQLQFPIGWTQIDVWTETY